MASARQDLARRAPTERPLDALKAALETEKQRVSDLRQERDRWAGLAEASQRQLVGLTKPPRGLARWIRWGA